MSTGGENEYWHVLDSDIDRVLAAYRDNEVYLEINAHPERLDLPDSYCKQAVEEGVAFAISTDAHDRSGLDLMEFGLNVARRGWLESSMVLNTLTANQLRKRLKRG